MGKQSEAQARHYRDNKQTYVDRARVRKQSLKQSIKELKESTPCADCGISYPYYVMDFDHLRDKAYEMNRLLAAGASKRIREEILKCEIVCSNCHRERTNRRSIVD